MQELLRPRACIIRHYCHTHVRLGIAVWSHVRAKLGKRWIRLFFGIQSLSRIYSWSIAAPLFGLYVYARGSASGPLYQPIAGYKWCFRRVYVSRAEERRKNIWRGLLPFPYLTRARALSTRMPREGSQGKKFDWREYNDTRPQMLPKQSSKFFFPL